MTGVLGTNDWPWLGGTVATVIGYLNGRVRGDVVVCGGVGYRVQTPQALPEGEDVELFVHTVIREDAFDLFGFTTPAEESLFRLLIKVAGVGPKMALTLMGSLGAPALAQAIGAEDHVTLTRVKGVGPKVAKTLSTAVTIPEDLILALGGTAVTPHDPPAPADEVDDVAKALIVLGYSRPEAVSRAAEARDLAGPDADDNTVIRVAMTRPEPVHT